MTDETKRRQTALAMLENVKELPSLPQVLVGISRVASDEKSKCDDLAEMILRDQALTMRLLRIANSAQYAVYAQRVTTVSNAVLLLGFESVRAIAMGAEMYRLLSQLTRAGEVLERFWKDSISVAVTSQEVAVLMGVPTPEEAFVAGLLHDVGKLVFAQCETEKAKRLYSLPIGGASMLEEEARVFGMNHAEMGTALARRWGLPPDITTAMENHHKAFSGVPKTRGDLIAFIVSVAKTLVAPMTLTDEAKRRDISAKMARLLRIPVGTVLGTIQRLPGVISEYADFFDIQVDDLKVYTLWVEEENSRLAQSVPAPEASRRRAEGGQAFFAAMRELHALLLSSVGSEGMLKKIADTARTVVGANRVLIAATKPAKDGYSGIASSGDVEQEFVGRFRISMGREGLLAPAVKEGRTVNVIDSRVPFFSRLMTKQDQATFDAPCLVAIPVVVDGAVAALFYADREDDDEPFADEELSWLETLASMAGIALKM